MAPASNCVNTVLGPVSADQLGVVSVHETLLSVLPGAEHAYDILMDRAEIFETLAGKLAEFRDHGGRTIVDSSGMFHGRDVRLLEALSRSTSVHVVASTGMGPEALLGGYFLTPQTDPPTPWPAEKFADLFTREVTEGMVVPRVERRGAAGMVVTAVTRTGMTATDESLLRGAARAALSTGVAVSIRFGDDALAELEVVLDEGIGADRVVVGGLDRKDVGGVARAVAERGAYVAIDHIGTEGLHGGTDYLTDAERIALVVELVDAGFADRILLSSSATGQAYGHEATDVSFSQVLTAFAPALETAGLAPDVVQRFLVANPAALLPVVER
jgi:phosphotriesterase-related protein